MAEQINFPLTYDGTNDKQIQMAQYELWTRRKEVAQLRERNAELEKALSAKTSKALLKYFLPCPSNKFKIGDSMEILFKQLLKIHDAQNVLSDETAKNFSPNDSLVHLYESFAELIIATVTCLERFGCDEKMRQKIFCEMNRRIANEKYTD